MVQQFTLQRERTSIRLGQELGRGGEGAVFAVEGQKDRVAKLYSSPPDCEKARKIAYMARSENSSLLNIAAWPLDLLIDGKEAVHGFIMPRIDASGAIHELYGPKSRSEAFPKADFRFLVHVAANVARAFAVVHGQGHVVGDVKHDNLLVEADGSVKLIDCDSFQIRIAKGHDRPNVYTCDVGVPLYTAPELQGRRLRGFKRTVNHDRFGLAVLLFHLLYMGRHPFAGRYSGPGEMPVEKAIGEYRFAYGPDCAANGMERPPGTVPLETMGDDIARLFIQAFGRDGSGYGRPVAATWVEALGKLKSNLRVCPQESRHHYPRELAACPWCPVESQGARLFRQGITAVGPTWIVDLETLWRAISAVPDPGAAPPLSFERPGHPSPGIKVLKIFRKVIGIGVGLVWVGLVLGMYSRFVGRFGIFEALIFCTLAWVIWSWVLNKILNKVWTMADRAYLKRKTNWEGALARWQREASRDAFAKKLKTLEKIRSEMIDLPNEERRRRLAELEAAQEPQQLQRYLDGFRIDPANISRLVASCGIETAADINQGKLVQMGKEVISELMRWRQGLEQDFRFDRSDPVYQNKIATIDQELEARGQNLLATLRQGVDDLQRLSQEIEAARTNLMPALKKAWDAFKTAEARRDAF